MFYMYYFFFKMIIYIKCSTNNWPQNVKLKKLKSKCYTDSCFFLGGGGWVVSKVKIFCHPPPPVNEQYSSTRILPPVIEEFCSGPGHGGEILVTTCLFCWRWCTAIWGSCFWEEMSPELYSPLYPVRSRRYPTYVDQRLPGVRFLKNIRF